MINTLDKKCKNILVNEKERSGLRHEIIEMFSRGKDKFYLTEMEEQFPLVSELYILLSLRE